MKARVLLLFAISAYSYGQSDCNTFSVSGTFNPDYAINSADHLSGAHTMTTNANWTCTYSGGPGTCQTLARIGIPNPVMSESGTVKTACHKDGSNTSTPQASGTGAQTVNGSAGGAAVACTFCACSVSISMAPFSVSPSPVWSHQATFSHTCDSKTERAEAVEAAVVLDVVLIHRSASMVI